MAYRLVKKIPVPSDAMGFIAIGDVINTVEDAVRKENPGKEYRNSAFSEEYAIGTVIKEIDNVTKGRYYGIWEEI